MAQDRESSGHRYYHAVEVNGLFEFSNIGIGGGAGIHEIHGCQFNPHWVLAMGVGFDYLYHKGVNYFGEPFKEDDFAFKLYANVRYFILKERKWTPLIMLSTGYFGIYEQSVRFRGLSPNNGIWEHGFMANLFLGANYRFHTHRNLYFGIVGGFDMPLSGFSIKIGMSF